MMIMLNIVTLILCVGILLLFRKIDRSGVGVSKLRRYSNRIFGEFRELADSEQRKLKDAAIEMDILEKKYNVLKENLSSSMREAETKLSTINMEKDNLERVEENIQIISNAAQDVNKQMEFIGIAKREINTTADRILGLQQALTAAGNESAALLEEFKTKLREHSRELSGGFLSVIDEHASKLNENGDRIYDLKLTLSDLENSVFANIKEKSDEMKEGIERAVTEFSSLKNDFSNKLNNDIEKIHEKLHNVEKTAEDSKANIIESFQNEVNRSRQEIDNINLLTIAKKDEVIKSARNEYQTALSKLETMSDKMKDEFSATERSLNFLKDEILEYEQKNKIFERTDSLTENVEEAVTRLSDILEKAQKEYGEINKFMEDSEAFTEVRKSVEREIRDYQARKTRLDTIESNIQNLMELSDAALNRVDTINNNVAKIDFVNSRIENLGKSYSDLESKIEELREHESLIHKNIEAANKSELLIKSVDTKLQGFQKTVDGSEKKAERLGKQLHDIESKTYELKNRMREFEDVNNKLDEIDSMRDLMEQHVKQINSMFSKVTNLRDNIDETDERLQKMYTQANEKMKEFATFIQAVPDSLISKQVNNGVPSGKNINENLIKTVRELSDMGWEPNDIARRMMIDENTVRLIINTDKL